MYFLNLKQKGNIVSSHYDSTIRFMFDGLGDDDLKKNPNGPFSNTTRMLLVDSILRNVSYISEKERLKLKLGNTLNHIVSQNLNMNNTVKVDDLNIDYTLKMFNSINSNKGIFRLKSFFFIPQRIS